jgi:hypothetical protein
VYRDGQALALGFCAGEVSVAFLPLSDATRAQLDPKTGCLGVSYSNYVLNDHIKMAIGSRFETRAAADLLRQELDRMARDGTLGGIVRPCWYTRPRDPRGLRAARGSRRARDRSSAGSSRSAGAR